MVFSSSLFIFVFLPIVFIGNLLVKNKYSNVFLLLASLLFYAWGEPTYVVLMLVSIFVNWIAGIVLSKTQGSLQKFCLGIGLLINLGVLVYFKYSNLVIKILNHIFRSKNVSLLDLALPIGISFFTFQAMSYIVDVYKGDTRASKNLVNVALYISFFPQLIAGPIVKYKNINNQIECRNVNWIDVSDGYKRFIYGLGKKVLISNVLGVCVDTIFAYDISIIDCKTAWIGALMYTFQIYYDFSGYSDMAIGLGKMFGFTYLENFKYPYLSHSVSEFWRKWHISLSAWFKEYVYIPLGGNRKGNFRTYINLVIVFFLTGLWHGADLSFIIWGMYHGFFLIVERLGLRKILEKNRIISLIYSFSIVNIGWVFFRSSSTLMGLRYISIMLMPWKHRGVDIEIWNYMDYKTVFVFICAVLGMGVINSITSERLKRLWKDSVLEAFFCVFTLLLSLSSIVSGTYNPFIYFQF